jgi:hypothetical protein
MDDPLGLDAPTDVSTSRLAAGDAVALLARKRRAAVAWMVVAMGCGGGAVAVESCGGQTQHDTGPVEAGGDSSGSSGSIGSSSGSCGAWRSGSSAGGGHNACPPMPGCPSNLGCPSPTGCGWCECNGVWACQIGTECPEAGAPEASTSCPAALPQPQGSCPSEGQTCNYPECNLDCACSNGQWACYYASVPECPADQPDGGACTQNQAGVNCTYANPLGCGYGELCVCDGTNWSCATGLCPTLCPGQAPRNGDVCFVTGVPPCTYADADGGSCSGCSCAYDGKRQDVWSCAAQRCGDGG